jgi:hypothetical protein
MIKAAGYLVAAVSATVEGSLILFQRKLINIFKQFVNEE